MCFISGVNMVCKKKIKIENFRGILFHIVGIVSLIWFLVRSGLAPHRSQYPCQQASRSMALVYIAYWSGLFIGMSLWMKRLKPKIYSLSSAIVATFIIAGIFSGSILNENVSKWNPVCKEPIGNPTGINPGRVAWVWNPHATQSELEGYWWESVNNNITAIEKMFSDGLRALTGKESDYEAWESLFKYFNKIHGKGNVSYKEGEKIAIKINMNNCWAYRNPYEQKDDDRDANPYVVKALLRQLVNVVGVSQEKITVYDASRPIPDWFYNRVYYKEYPSHLQPEFSGIHFIDAEGGAEGREKVVASNIKIYFHDGTVRTLPRCVAEADYVINMPLLKRHPINNGVTLSGKNLFGTWMEPVEDIHEYHESGMIMGNPTPQVDLLAHESIGGKTLLYIGDGTFATKKDHKTIEKFKMYPFNNDWTNSLFFSQDPVAIDSVMYDFLYAEGTNPTEGAQNYLHQCAEPSANTYDPENDGVYLSKSLGVHEHWDTSVDIFSPDRYSGADENGIDFIAIGKEYAKPTVRIINPEENYLYFIGKKILPTPITIIIGEIDVMAEMEGNEGNVEKMEFYVDKELRYIDYGEPYIWEWKELSFSFHDLKVVAYFNGNSVSSEIKILKLL